MNDRSSRAAGLGGRERCLAGLAVLALVTWLGFGLDAPFARPLALVFLVAVPVGSVALFRIRARKTSSPLRRVLFASSLLAVFLAWLPLAALAGLIVLASEPWPLSLRQGPDTDHGRALFERYAGFPPPPTVSELYARNEWAGFGEHVTSITFLCEDASVLERIVERLRLVPVPAEEVASLASFAGPAWWPEPKRLGAASLAYRRASGSDPQFFLHVWFNEASGTIHLQDVDVA